MSDEFVQVHFAYWDGDHDELEAAHKQVIEANGIFDIGTMSISGPFGTVQIRTNDVPEITSMSHLEHYEYVDDSMDIDLLYAPLVKYFLVESQYLDEETHTTNISKATPLEQFIELVTIGYQATEQKPAAVYAESPPHNYWIATSGTPPFTAESLAHNQYHHLSWLTIFTPPMVEHYGRETLLSAPAWKVEELDDGAILVVCHDDVAEWQTDCHDVAEHIGLPWYTDIE
ncbi:hypothetical protein [Halorussus lipolyticus]|uniref:hypothetical protein n=1 Tax=Halorussus lipolyticus TaxID=3034024 RepID=UPI0023E7A9A9|nr:hypothetical protein [Halorussus sp. DT80]